MNYFEFSAFEKAMPDILKYIRTVDNENLLKIYDVLFAYSQLSKGCAAENLRKMPIADFTSLIPVSHLAYIKKLTKAKVKLEHPLKRLLQRTKAYFRQKNNDYETDHASTFRAFMDLIPAEYVTFRPDNINVSPDAKYFVNLQTDFTMLLHDTSLEIAKRKLNPGFRYQEPTTNRKR